MNKDNNLNGIELKCMYSHSLGSPEGPENKNV